MNIDTIIGSRIATSVRFNSTIIPASGIFQYIMSFTAPALFHSEGMDEFHLSKSGSLTKVYNDGKYYVLVTYHQFLLGNYSFDQLALVGVDPAVINTCNGVIFPEGNSDTLEDYDCLLFDFSTAVQAGALSSSGWYDLSFDIERRIIPKPICVCSVGFPSEHNYICYDPPEYAAKALPILGKECEPLLSGRLSFKPIKDLPFDPKGISGCPVFGFYEESEGLRANFAGIVTNASKSTLNFMPLSRIRQLFLN